MFTIGHVGVVTSHYLWVLWPSSIFGAFGFDWSSCAVSSFTCSQKASSASVHKKKRSCAQTHGRAHFRAVGIYFVGFMAEREGFEPPIPLRVCLISSQVHSTGLCHLSAFINSFVISNILHLSATHLQLSRSADGCSIYCIVDA